MEQRNISCLDIYISCKYLKIYNSLNEIQTYLLNEAVL